MDEEEKIDVKRSSGSLNQENINEELEEIFHDANDFMASDMSIKGSKSRMFSDPKNEESKEQDDPPERNVLPYFKDPKARISIWTIIKDSITKDLSKITVPVYFNEPTNLL